MHPFQGPIAYPFARPEGDRLYQVLRRDITAAGLIDRLLKTASDALPALNEFLTPAERWRQGLEQVAVAGALLRLCEVLTAYEPAPDVRTAAQAMLDVQPAVARRVLGRRFVVDRVSLREGISRLSLTEDNADSVKVLLVRGGRKTGKTWSRHLFERAARERGADPTYLYQSMIPTVDLLIDKLFSVLGASDSKPPRDTSDAAWYQQVCYRLPEAAERRGRPLWIAVDDLGPGPDGVTPMMDSEIRRFFDEFTLHLVDPAVSRWFRLMLIHYPDGPVPTRWDEELWTEDRTRPEMISQTDVIAVVREWLDDHGRTLPEDAVVSLADQVIATAGPRGTESWLAAMHKALAFKLQDLVRPAP
jgi:hypothetical protein